MKHEYNHNLNPLDIDSYLIFLATFFLIFYYLKKLFLVVLYLCVAALGLSLVVASRGLLFVVGHGLLIVASLVVELGSWVLGLQ